MKDLQDTIVLDAFVQVEDRVVVVSIQPYTRHPEIKVGDVLICVGHTHRKDYNNFGWIRRNRPRGVYLQYGAALYRLEREHPAYVDRYFTYNASHLRFEDEKLQKQESRYDTHVWNMYHDGVMIGDIPETKFQVGDWVSVRNLPAADGGEGIRQDNPTFLRGEIENINFERPSATGERLHTYDVRFIYRDKDGNDVPGGTRPFMDENNLDLISRGNYYFYYHDKSKLCFQSLAEEANFYARLGFAEQVKNPVTDNYGFTVDQALDLIAAGGGCVLSIAPDMFDSKPSQPVVYAFPDMPDLARRCAIRTLEVFSAK